jgi:hypothetical protein
VQSWWRYNLGMLAGIIPMFIYSSGAAWFYYKWTQDYHPLHKWSFQLLGVLLLCSVWSLFEGRVLNLQGTADLINFASLTVIRIAATILLLYVSFWPNIKFFRPWEKMSDNDYLAQYIHYAQEWGKRLEPTDVETVKKGDRGYGMCWWLYIELKKRDPKCRALKTLLKHKDVNVRVLAARHLIWTETTTALETLEKASSYEGDIGRLAREWAKGWKEGRIIPDSDLVKKDGGS